MVKPSCSSGDSRSSAPIPLIGLYIAGATSVCLILMLCDIISSFRRKTRYIPCKLFSVNSATLTLLAIASKLPVDLTTYMPRAGDQLSKLTGTTLVCISICFFMPSLGINGEAESITNMIALSLFIITIAVNICIQIYTGVIFLFIVEHIMILCCLLMLLTVLWPYTFVVNTDKISLNETMRNILKKGEASTSLLQKVRLWYMSSCISNPQYLKRGADYGLSVVMICFLCLAVVSQAAFRSLVFHKLDLCTGVSDYGWSITIILVSQIITIAVGGLAAAFRWITMVSDPQLRINVSLDVEYDLFIDIEQLSFLYLVKNRELQKDSIKFLWYLILKVVIVVMALVTFYVLGAPLYVIRAIFRKLMRIFSSCCAHLTSSNTNSAFVPEKWKTELREVFRPTQNFPEWIMSSCVKDMNKWMEVNAKSPPNHLIQMLLKPRHHPPQTLLKKMEQICINKGYYRLSCLSLVFLVKVIALCTPFALAEPVMQALDEAFVLIHYIDKKINVGSFEDERKRQYAKVMLAYKNIRLSREDLMASEHKSVDEALSSIENENQAFPIGYADKEMEIIRDFILDQQCASIDELYEHLEQLFVDMLLFFLPQLPTVIYKEVYESPIEVHEERARSVLKLLYKLKLLEEKVQWLFPEDSRVTREEEDHDQSARNSTVV